MRNLITTFPLGARSLTPPLGILMPPILADSFHRCNKDSDLVIAINTLDTFQERKHFFAGFKDGLEKVGIDTKTNVWWDENNIDSLLNSVAKLEYSKILQEEVNKVSICDCGIVEKLESAPLNPGARNYRIEKQVQIRCNSCESVAKAYNIATLVATFPHQLPVPLVRPKHLRKEVQHHIEFIRGRKFLVSRKRDSGPTYSTRTGNHFNLDVDFLWSNITDTLMMNHDKIYIMGSNHVSWHLSLEYAIFWANNQERNTPVELVLPSYLVSAPRMKEIVKSSYQTRGVTFSRALVLSSISWKKRNSQWDAGIPKHPQHYICKDGASRSYSENEIFRLLTDRKNIHQFLRGKLNASYLNTFYSKVLL